MVSEAAWAAASGGGGGGGDDDDGNEEGVGSLSTTAWAFSVEGNFGGAVAFPVSARTAPRLPFAIAQCTDFISRDRGE